MNYEQQLETLIKAALTEDIGPGDYSTLATIDKIATGKAVLKIKEDCTIAGIQVASKIFNLLDPQSVFIAKIDDGNTCLNGDIAFEVNSKIHVILSAERLVLNCMQRMSGIATLTKKYVHELKGFSTRLLDTRKTTPNFRLLEKEAVKIGGGTNHRFGLYDMIMLKDNHIDYAGGINNALNATREFLTKGELNLKVEIEARSLSDVELIVANGKADIIMLDNFTPGQINEALKIIPKQFKTEASGGINLNNIKEYAATGVDFISSGALIHQAKSVDLSLKAKLN